MITPNCECIIVARKPVQGSIVENVIENGVGGINIDECRIGNEERQNSQAGFIRRGRTDEEVFMGVDKNKPKGTLTVNGRFPANTILTFNEIDEDEVCGNFPQSKGASSQNNYSNGHIYRGQSLQESNTSLSGYRDWYNDDGSASRYFKNCKYTSKDINERLERELKADEKIYRIINGNMLEELDKLEENSIDSIVTDPPYELNFMNKGWDNAGVSFNKETWKKCLRVLKPRRAFISIWRK